MPLRMNLKNIRNFCIIAHIDHGKSTLADRFLELTGTIEKRDMKDQILDSMELERERGITIKLQPARMKWQYPLREKEIIPSSPLLTKKGEGGGLTYELNLIDTPGHVDFTYEVSRSLAAVEGVILLVDASQGVQAQTLANLYLALDQNLEIIPVINKIDLPHAEPEKVEEEIISLLGCKKEDILRASGKTGQGVAEILNAIIERIPAPAEMPSRGVSDKDAPLLQALIFDSNFDDYRGVITFVRLRNGTVKKGDRIIFLGTKTDTEVLEVGYFSPKYHASPTLEAGEIGYIVTGLKDISHARVGDTITHTKYQSQQLSGYKTVKPMVFAGLFCRNGEDVPRLHEALERLQLSDAALQFQPEHSTALGPGFRCGFLGMLHLDIIQERLKREFNLDLVVTVPSVEYHVTTSQNETITVTNPSELPDPTKIIEINEPWMSVDILTPETYLGGIIGLIHDKRGVLKHTDYISHGSNQRVIVSCQLPLSALLVDFYDKLKSVSSGYASLNYDFFEYRTADVVRLDIFVSEELVEALSSIVYRDEADRAGRHVVKTLKEHIPREMFDIKLQAAIGAKIIASERIPPMRKDVTAKLYGGDVTRRRKLLEKQKKGKKKMKELGQGSVQIPTKAFLEILKR